MKTSWKPVKDYEDFYEVSSLGEVLSKQRVIEKRNGSTQTIKEKLLKPILKDGYLRVVLYKDGKLQRKYLHVLVAEHFKKNPYNKKEVNHKDGNKLNCKAGNLEWHTRSENVKHMWDTGLRK